MQFWVLRCKHSKWVTGEGGKLWTFTQHDILSDERLQNGSHYSSKFTLLLVISYKFLATSWSFHCRFISGSVSCNWIWFHLQFPGNYYYSINHLLVFLKAWILYDFNTVVIGTRYTCFQPWYNVNLLSS